MVSIKNWMKQLKQCIACRVSDFDLKQLMLGVLILLGWLFISFTVIYAGLHSPKVFAAGTITLPGEDMSGSLGAAGILLKMLDTGIFKWGARLFAGLCIMSSGWALKEQRFGVAVICVVGAILFGTAPKWVSNLFDIGGNTGVFSLNSTLPISITASNGKLTGSKNYG